MAQEATSKFGGIQNMQCAFSTSANVHESDANEHGSPKTMTRFPARGPPPPPGDNWIARAANVDVTTKSAQKMGKRIEWLFNLIGKTSDDGSLFLKSAALYQASVNQAALPEFYQGTQMAPEFRAQQNLLMLHVWMVHHALRVHGEDAKVLQEEMFDRLWEDSAVRVRRQPVPEVSVNKYVQEVQTMCFTAAVEYDNALLNTDDPNAFNKALQKHLLGKTDTSKPCEIARAIEAYVRREMKMTQALEKDVLFSGDIPWGPAPPVSDAAAKSGIDEDPEIIGRRYGNWRSALNLKGKFYYYNMRTRVSQWEKPTEDQLWS